LFLIALIYLLDVESPGASFGTVAILPVLAGAWLLSGRLALLVGGLAVGFRLAAGFGASGHGLEVVTEAISLGLVAGLARVAAVYVAATREAAARDSLLARIARIATSAETIRQILDQILAEMARDGLRGGLIGLINEHNEIYPVA